MNEKKVIRFLDDPDDDGNSTVQPVHFRECLRRLDVALNSPQAPVLPRWCASERLTINIDPMILINGYRRYLSYPMDKSESQRFLRKAQPLKMKMDLIDVVTVRARLS